jgi:hypothetical protein
MGCRARLRRVPTALVPLRLRKGRSMPDPTQNRPGDNGERCDETSSDESFADEMLDPEEVERRITQFVTSADELSGPRVKELAEQVATLMRTAWSDFEEIMAGKAHYKMLATQLLLGQRTRELQPDDPEQWRLYAATMLLSGMVVRNVEG